MAVCSGCTAQGCNCSLTVVDTATLDLTLTGTGAAGDPWILSGEAAGGGGGTCQQKNVYTVATVGPAGLGLDLGTQEPFLSCADFVGDGVNDEVAINAAVTAAIGTLLFNVWPEVYLNSGLFATSGAVDCQGVTIRGTGLSFITNSIAASGFPILVDPGILSYVNPGSLLAPNNDAVIAILSATGISPRFDHVEAASQGIGAAPGIIYTTIATALTMEYCDFANNTAGAVFPISWPGPTNGRISIKDCRFVGCSLDISGQFIFGTYISRNIFHGNSVTPVVGNRGLINIINNTATTGQGMMINENMIEGSPGHGIVIDGGSGGGLYTRMKVHDNLIDQYGITGATAYDGIFLIGNVDEIDIQNNYCRSVSAGARHGINISAATCNDNLVTNNNLFNSGGGASINDAGTATILAAGNRL